MSAAAEDPGAFTPRGAPPHAARQLVAVPYRQAGLIALCALAGVALSTSLSLLHPPHPASGLPAQQSSLHAPALRAAILASRDALDRGALRLKLALEPEPAMAPVHAPAQPVVQSPGATLRMDDSHPVDLGDLSARWPAPAAGPANRGAAGRSGPVEGVPGAERVPRPVPGLVLGVLLGLTIASLRELRGGRMRTPREAEWALGAPVLGAIPTLSARARAASVALRSRPVDGAMKRT